MLLTMKRARPSPFQFYDGRVARFTSKLRVEEGCFAGVDLGNSELAYGFS